MYVYARLRAYVWQVCIRCAGIKALAYQDPKIPRGDGDPGPEACSDSAGAPNTHTVYSCTGILIYPPWAGEGVIANLTFIKMDQIETKMENVACSKVVEPSQAEDGATALDAVAIAAAPPALAGIEATGFASVAAPCRVGDAGSGQGTEEETDAPVASPAACGSVESQPTYLLMGLKVKCTHTRTLVHTLKRCRRILFLDVCVYSVRLSCWTDCQVLI